MKLKDGSTIAETDICSPTYFLGLPSLELQRLQYSFVEETRGVKSQPFNMRGK